MPVTQVDNIDSLSCLLEYQVVSFLCMVFSELDIHNLKSTFCYLHQLHGWQCDPLGYPVAQSHHKGDTPKYVRLSAFRFKSTGLTYYLAQQKNDQRDE